MTKKRFLPPLVLLALLLASCAPAASPAPTVDQPSIQEPASPTAVEPGATSTPDVVEAPSESAAPTPLPVATSRGPDLHATDPGTVSLASGQLQFVEFFRFT
jgi:PBP1b-binding outer membrane lipoprotein LpoB